MIIPTETSYMNGTSVYYFARTLSHTFDRRMVSLLYEVSCDQQVLMETWSLFHRPSTNPWSSKMILFVEVDRSQLKNKGNKCKKKMGIKNRWHMYIFLRIIRSCDRGASVLWHHLLLLMNSFNKTKATISPRKLCFLKIFPLSQNIADFGPLSCRYREENYEDFYAFS